MQHDDIIAACDPGIRRVVAWLRERGFKTTDSGDGVAKPAAGDEDALTEPHVFMVTHRDALADAADRLQAELAAAGFTPRAGRVQSSYDPADGVAVLALVGIDDRDLDAPA
jgi:hypothetical protein